MSGIPHYSVTQLAFGGRHARQELAVDYPISEETAAIVADFKANALPPDPRSRYEYAALKKCGLVAFAVVKHADRERSIVVSRDGGATPRVCLPKSIRYLQVQPESADDFLLVIFPQYLARKIYVNDRVDLLGVERDLSTEREWTAGDRTSWKTINRWVGRINAGIRAGGRQKFTGTRNDAA